MKRIAVTITEEQSERLSREAHRRRVSGSELVREKLDLSNEEHLSPRILGLADKNLPYDFSGIDEELDETFGRA